ncbi:hypothetical protein XELAEV_18040912mg [Xenopus laevis]|uniref:Uncharacterized protein n=1 Tax=Xenopus laevis TaxID=8355 RepID=A0A974CBL9_XENLA|nr:hypothetical protein XELAEV_18040912mg [Xenopus laevis]
MSLFPPCASGAVENVQCLPYLNVVCKTSDKGCPRPLLPFSLPLHPHPAVSNPQLQRVNRAFSYSQFWEDQVWVAASTKKKKIKFLSFRKVEFWGLRIN